MDVPTTTSPSCLSPIVRKPKNWMVAVDESVESEWAFWTAVFDMDRERDSLYLMSVTPDRLSEEDTSRNVLLPLIEKAELAKVTCLYHVTIVG